MDDGDRLLTRFALLLKVFILLESPRTREYTRALAVSLLQWLSMKQSGHPCWTMFNNNACAFNEERGEISFSVLARDIARGGVRSDIKMVNKRYQLLKHRMRVARDLGAEVVGDDFKHTVNNRIIKTTDPEVGVAKEYLYYAIRSIEQCAYRHFEWKDNGHQAVITEPLHTPECVLERTWRPVCDDIPQMMRRFDEALTGYWVYPYSHIWPGAVPVISDHSSDESLPSQRDTVASGTESENVNIMP